MRIAAKVALAFLDNNYGREAMDDWTMSFFDFFSSKKDSGSPTTKRSFDRNQEIEKEVFGQNGRAFHFGEREVIGSQRDLYDHGEVGFNGKWYEPRYEQSTLCKLLHQTAYHESAIDAKANILLTTIKLPKPSQRKISRDTLLKLIKDYLVLGHCYPYFRRTHGGKLVGVDHEPGLIMRRGKDEDDFYRLNHEQQFYAEDDDTQLYTHYPEGVLHLKRYDLRQGVYGVPGYLGALDAAWLNTEATLLRRRFYNNGAHMGFVFLLTDATMDDDSVDELEEQMLQSKGVGNFKNLFMHLPGGDPESVKIMPVGDIATKDDYFNIKVSTRNDVLAQHRVPLVLLSIMPETTGGLGKPQDAAIVFAKNEIEPLHYVFEKINEFARETVIDFEDYSLPDLSASAAPSAPG